MGGETYTYDENGSTLTKTLDSDVVTYGYNAKNKLISMTDQNTVASYVYNIDGIRTGKVENGQAIQYLLDLNRDYAQVLKETNGTNEINYTYGDDLLTQDSNGLTSTYLYDGLGSTRSLTNEAGSVTDDYDYEAFGETLNRTGTTENNYLYAGEQFDASLDNYYLRARYYDQNSGRFTQQDTYLGNNSDPVTLHKYLYANADPVNHIDPSGNFSLGSIGAANSIRGILMDVQVNVGFSLLDGIFSGDSPQSSEILFGLFSMGGQVAFKMMKLLNNRVRKACNSFDEDTEVWTEFGNKLIADILIGDKVWAFNEETGEFELQDVTHLIQREGEYNLIEITVANGTIDATENHPFYVKGNDGWVWKDAAELKVDDLVLDRHSNGQVIAKINARHHKGKVFNLTVDNVHTYLVGQQGIVAHNVQKVCPIDGLVLGAKKPAFKRNPKHTKGGGGQNGNLPKGLEPPDSKYVFENVAVKAENGRWYAKSSNGQSIYRYFVDKQGVAHWSGGTADKSSPLNFANIPAGVKRALGFKDNGKLK